MTGFPTGVENTGWAPQSFFGGGRKGDLSQYMGRGWDASKKRENILLENVIFLLN